MTLILLPSMPTTELAKLFMFDVLRASGTERGPERRDDTSSSSRMMLSSSSSSESEGPCDDSEEEEDDEEDDGVGSRFDTRFVAGREMGGSSSSEDEALE